ncbi:ABC transporter ATP-binding protein [Pseudochelatococcus lubricantis]|uniref:ABC transporter ATP-binding protein n=1 Tax=Pseudochelatococcus lubricantis TaxID=1538102 RepID=UPI00142364A9|nr:oligopeptide/dipeptide ABC transporter ATP-binding protein [Pseudochelatococcus lubricantis]
MPLVEAQGVTKHFRVGGSAFATISRATVKAVAGADLAVDRGETLAVVGESGCGKSTLGRLLLGLMPPSSGRVMFDGHDLAGLGSPALRRLRARMQLVFQNPLQALDPRMSVGEQIVEPTVIHPAAGNRLPVADLLAQVGLDPALAGRFPHQLSGGQRQRVVIARAMATQPDFIVFDEPVSALDVSVQAQIIRLIRDLQTARGFASVFISHDLRVVRHVADRVAVMYLGRIVEEGPVRAVFAEPLHPYTQALIAAVPRLAPGMRRVRVVLKGEPPNPAAIPSGCPFHPRCPVAEYDCRTHAPARVAAGPARSVACIRVASGSTFLPAA